ncbi:MAG: condensation domain-containing protein [Acidimicrobiales bacterium]
MTFPAGGHTDTVPFTVMDEAIHHLDTPSEPWSVEVEVAVAGRIDPARLRWALGQALARHPMTRARCLPARRTDRTYTWELTPVADLDPVSVVDCPGEAALAEARDRLVSLSVPLAESPPFRLRVARGTGGDRVLLNANHAAFDGFGCVRLLQSVGRIYEGRDDPLPDLSLADARDVERHLAAGSARAWFERLWALADKVADEVRAPARLAPDGGSDEPGYRLVHRTLNADTTRRLTDHHRPGTVNDALMAALHLAVDRWNREHGAATGRVGVLMPVNLRPREWRNEVVTNFVLMARVATDAEDRHSTQAALEAVAGQTTTMKRWGTGAALVEVLGRTRRLPLWAKQLLSPLLWLTGNRLVDTAMLSNLGRVGEPPGFGPTVGETTGLWFSAPCRLPCALSLGIAGVGGRLDLSFRWRRPAVGAAAAQRFADLYLEEVGRLAVADRMAA